MDEHDLLLRHARAAYQRGDFDTTYRSLTQARGEGTLQADDLNTLATAAWWLGLMKETVEVSEEVHRRFLAEGHVSKAAMSALDIGFLWGLRGELAIGSGWISRARRLLEDQPESVEHAFLHYFDVSSTLDSLGLDEAVALARQVQANGVRFESPTLTSLGLVAEGTVRITFGEVSAGFALLDEAMLPVLAGDVPPDWAGNLYCQLMEVCDRLADLRRAREWTAATERWCERFTSAAMFIGVCRVHRVQLLIVAGMWDHAEREAGTVCTELAQMNIQVVAEGHYLLGEIHRLRGKAEAARSVYAIARTLGREPQPGEALLQLALGQTETAWEAVTAALAVTGADPFRRARLLVAQVEIALAAGLVADAERACGELDVIGRTYASPGFLAWTAHSLGATRLRQGRLVEAIPALQEALQRYQSLDAPYDTARVRLLLADALRASGQDAAANAKKVEALDTLARLGAPVEGLGGGLPPGGLTTREVDVLVRIAEGSTNREAAAELFISEKTVSRHLANIYAKLGVSSRTAAASWAYGRGLTRDGGR